MARQTATDVLDLFHPVTAEWFQTALGEPTAPQRMGWPAIARGESTLILAPTGTGKTLTAFLWCLDRLVFGERAQACRVRALQRGRSAWVWRFMGRRSACARGTLHRTSAAGSGGVRGKF